MGTCRRLREEHVSRDCDRDYARFRAIADANGALMMVDMAHISGLVATQEVRAQWHPSSPLIPSWQDQRPPSVSLARRDPQPYHFSSLPRLRPPTPSSTPTW